MSQLIIWLPLFGAPSSQSTDISNNSSGKAPTNQAQIDSIQLDENLVPLLPDSSAVDTTSGINTELKPTKPIIPPVALRRDSSIAYFHQIQSSETELQITRHLGDWLKNVPGVTLHDLTSTGLPAFSRIRGSSLQHPIVHIDGIPLNHSQFGPLNLNLLPSENFESLQVLYEGTRDGHTAPVGVINLRTRSYNLKKPYSKIAWRLGSKNESEVDVTFGQKIAAHTDAIAAVCYHSSAGNFFHSQYAAQKIRTQIISQIHPRWQVNYQLFHNRSDVDYPGPQNWQSNTPNLVAHLKDIFYNHLVSTRGNIFADSLEDIKVQFYYNSLYHEYRDLPNQFDGVYQNRFVGSQAETYVPVQTHLLTFGTRYEYRWMRSNELRNSGFHDGAVYCRQQLSLSNHFQLQYLARFEMNNKFGFHLSPNLSIKYRKDKNLTFGVDYQFTRRLPNFFELYWENGYFKGNQNLKPEMLNTISFSHWFKQSAWLNLQGSTFFHLIDHSISMTAVTDTSQVKFVNQSSRQIIGHDQQIEFRIKEKFNYRVTLSLLFAHDNDEKYIPYRPFFSIQNHLSYHIGLFNNNLDAKFRLTFLLIGRQWHPIQGNYPYPSYYFSNQLEKSNIQSQLNFKAFGKIRDANIFFAVENILAQKIEYTKGFPREECLFRWGLIWNFWN